jgi:hypothetical protein
MTKLSQNDIKKAQEFWVFFEQEQKNLFNKDEALKIEVLDAIAEKLQAIHEDIYLEVGSQQNGSKLLVINTTNEPGALSYVELVHEHRLNFDDWAIHRLRPAMDNLEDFELDLDDKTKVKFSEVLFEVLDAPEGLIIGLFIPGFEEGNEVFDGIGSMIIELCLGEELAAKSIAGYDVFGMDAVPEEDLELGKLDNVCGLKALVDSVFAGGREGE